MHTTLYTDMRARLGSLEPDFEIRRKAELVATIQQLKVERNALVLGHNYMEPAIYHFVADIVGDSLELCRKAQAATQDLLIFCGVEFMAETAKILNPSRKVLIPAAKAGCSLAESITAADVRRLRAQYPGVPVVTYINTYADVKAETDICCTSGNAAAVVESLKTDTVIFLPDEYLARNVAIETGKHIIFPTLNSDHKAETTLDKVFIGWRGRCEVHEQFTVSDISRMREQFPDVRVLAHPECSPEVVAASDFAGSTSAMIRYVKEKPAAQYLLLTECSMGDNIIASKPEGEILRLCSIRCPHMNQITLEDTVACLQELKYEVKVDPVIAAKARLAIERMLAIG